MKSFLDRHIQCNQGMLKESMEVNPLFVCLALLSKYPDCTLSPGDVLKGEALPEG